MCSSQLLSLATEQRLWEELSDHGNSYNGEDWWTVQCNAGGEPNARSHDSILRRIFVFRRTRQDRGINRLNTIACLAEDFSEVILRKKTDH